jgi:hypothetical protein
MATLIVFNIDNTSIIHNPNELTKNIHTFFDLYHYFMNHVYQLKYYNYDDLNNDYPAYCLNRKRTDFCIAKIENHCISYWVSGLYIGHYEYFLQMENLTLFKYKPSHHYLFINNCDCFCQNCYYNIICTKCINTYLFNKHKYQLLSIHYFNLVNDVKNVIKNNFIYL